MDHSNFNLFNVCSKNCSNSALAKKRFCPQLAGGLKTPLSKNQSPDAKVSELVFIRQVDNLGHIAYSGHANFMFNIEGVFKCCTFTRACSVSNTNHKYLLYASLHLCNDVLQILGRFHSVPSGANRNGEPVRSKARSSAKI
jgi:hypothetical protein